MTVYNGATPRIVRVDSVQSVKVVRVETTEGTGVKDDPVRRVVTFYDEDGTFLARRDDGGPEVERGGPAVMPDLRVGS